MKKICIIATALVFTVCNTKLIAQIQTPILNQQIIAENGQPMLLGHCSISAYKNEPYANWFIPNFDNYTVDSATIEQIRPLLKKKKMDLFMGTWCGDSKHEVPRIIKILLAAGMDTAHLSIIAVGNGADMYKKSPQGEEMGLNIRRVPTLIVYDKKKEMGRFIEYPVVSIEKDLLRILQKDGYIPNYANLKE
ncbi:MAG: thioredoxin family protein [Sphingobacteriia bacterium]|jgi:thiol-disulfide isomerase/thioredoxin